MSPLKRVLVPKRIVESLASHRRQSGTCETGGFLIGLRRGPHIEVTEITAQKQTDISTPTRFARLDKGHGHEVENAWSASGGYSTLVGDWHTHPLGRGAPSWLDKQAWKTLAHKMKSEGVGLIFAAPPLPKAFRFAHDADGNFIVQELSLIADDDADLVLGLSESTR